MPFDSKDIFGYDDLYVTDKNKDSDGDYLPLGSGRKSEFEDNIHVSLFKPIENRVRFLDYSRIVGTYEEMRAMDTLSW